MPIFFLQRSNTAANLTTENPTLEAGQLGFETDTGRFKLGDGATVWTSLGYIGFSVAEAASLGTAPSYLQFKRLTGVPNKLYVSLEGTAGWDWINIVNMP